MRRMKLSSLEDVIRRIEETPLPENVRQRMLRRPQDLDLSDSARLYKMVDFGASLPLSGGRRCRVDWKNHAKYRAELRGIDSKDVSTDVCRVIDRRHFDPKNPRRELPKVDKTRLKIPEGTAIVHYDARRAPDVPVNVITTWASSRRMASRISDDVVFRLSKKIFSGRVRMKGSGRVDDRATASLRKVKLRARNSGDMSSAIISAGYYAKKHNKLTYVYLGNSYMHSVWNATFKESDAFNPINNTGSFLFTVSPDLTVTRFERLSV